MFAPFVGKRRLLSPFKTRIDKKIGLACVKPIRAVGLNISWRPSYCGVYRTGMC